MKSFALLALLASASAFASSPAPIYYSQVSNVSVNGAVANPSAKGQLQINQLDNTLKLTITVGTACPPHVMCMTGQVVMLDISLPVTDLVRNPNGARVITASQDKRPVDGALQKLVILESADGMSLQGRYLSQAVDRTNGKAITRRIQFDGSKPMMIYPKNR